MPEELTNQPTETQGNGGETPEPESNNNNTAPENVDNVKHDIDWGKYDPTVKEIFEKGEKDLADAIQHLLNTKREATSEAKDYRKALEEAQKQIEETKKMDTDKITAEIEAKAKAELEALAAEKAEKEQALLDAQAKIKDYELEKTFRTLEVSSEFLPDAKALIQLPEKQENETDEAYKARLDEVINPYKEKYPQWFGAKGSSFNKDGAIKGIGKDNAFDKAREQNDTQGMFYSRLKHR